ncbi:Uncharacterised protein [Chlamydia trachomatis]|nr:Uncharacterised protein [Chlamydia trachomatis]
MDVHHDLVELRVSFLERPLRTTRVLLHFQSGGGNTTGVRGFAGSVGNTRGLQGFNRFRGGRHVCALGDQLNAVLNQGVRGLNGEFVLSCTRQSDVTRQIPDGAARNKSR